MKSPAAFDRKFFDAAQRFATIGTGSLGGKAEGLLLFHRIVAERFPASSYPDVEVTIPSLAVVATDFFDAFMAQNQLWPVATSDEPDDRIALAFQQASLPAELVGDLRAVVQEVHTPLAIRSSSMLEDAAREPFAGIYETKMIPNNQPDADARFTRLTEAIKFVYASTFFRAARDYRQATRHAAQDEKMAVILQEVVGQRHGDRFYPHASGVARSYNFYPTGTAKPAEGVVQLALGLGKTVVDGGKCWTYAPTRPRAVPPFGSVGDWLRQTQTEFWAVNMGKPPGYDPIRETEYLTAGNLSDAELDGALRHIASTYNPASDRISPGISGDGPRILSFAPLLQRGPFPANEIIRTLLRLCEEAAEAPVEIEFALTFDPHRFGCLQVRPLNVSGELVDLADTDFTGARLLVASRRVCGNGEQHEVRDIVYVKPETFESRNTQQVAKELEEINRALLEEQRPYLLIGFGRWGSSDPWLGIPVNWGQVSGARAIVETSLPGFDIEPSQGSHFFHNITSLQVSYFHVHHEDASAVDWAWLNAQPSIVRTDLVRHIRLEEPIHIRVDGRSGSGIILKPA